MALGLVVHWRGAALGPTLRDELGDALWAAMVAWWVGAVAPGVSRRRPTTAGRLVLGSGFDPRDLVAYTLGVIAVAFLERAVVPPAVVPRIV